MSSCISSVKILPALFYCVVALRVADGDHGSTIATEEEHLHSNATEEEHVHSLLASLLTAPTQHSSSEASVAPVLLTKMRATLFQKAEKTKGYHLEEEAANSSVVPLDTSDVQHGKDATHSKQEFHNVRNMSALPIGAAPLQFQHAEQSEFQASAPQAVLPQLPHPNMTSAPQSREIPEEEAQGPGSTNPIQFISSASAVSVHSRNVDAKPAHWFSEESSPVSGPVERALSDSEIDTMKQNANLRVQNEPSEESIPHGEINVFNRNVKVRVQNRTLPNEINSVVSSSLVEPHTWIAAPSKEKTTVPLTPLYGKPFENGKGDHFAQSKLSTANLSASKAMVTAEKLQSYSPRTSQEDTNKEEQAMPLPPKTLYGQSAALPFSTESGAPVDSSTRVQTMEKPTWVAIASQAEPHQVLVHESTASAIQANPVLHAAPRRASVVRSRSPPSSTAATQTPSPPDVAATYYPGHGGSESPVMIPQPKETGKDDVVNKQGDATVATWTIWITVVLLLTLMVLLIVVMPLKGLCPSIDQNGQASEKGVRKWVESFRVTNVEHIENTFKPRGGYDCLLLQPQNPGIAVRIQGVVVSSQQSYLRAPITRRKCVLFSTSALERRLDGVVAPPVAFHSMAVNFALELGPHCKLEVRGQDVALFDMAAGRHEENVVLRDASELMQDFVRAHRTPFFGARDNNYLDFQECVLEVGAKVTCVGEVRRSENGELGLWPIHHDIPSEAIAVSSASGLTSWERLGCPSSGESQVEKVMISDDPQLLR